MIKNKVKYLLGIDGGGTKTEFLLTDMNGKEIKRIILGASNPVNLGIENTCRLLSEGINKICAELDYSEISVYAGIAGAKTGDNEKLITEFLSGFGFGAFASGSDIDLALELTLKGENGTVVIMGTGEPFDNFDNVLKFIELVKISFTGNPLSAKSLMIVLAVIINIAAGIPFPETSATRKAIIVSLSL